MNKTQLQLSKRSQLVGESPIRKLVPFADAAKKKGITVYHLNIGQPDIQTIPSMRAAYSKAPEVIAYGPSQGLPELREAFAEYYAKNRINIGSDELYITNGGSEAIIFALMAITSTGDEVIVPEPYYANYNGFAAMAGVRLVPLTTHLEAGFHLPDIEDFEKKTSSKTRAILFSNPGNPSGAVFSEEKLQELADFAKRRSLFLISDEVYREFTYGERRAISIMEFEGLEEHAVMVDSVSKRFSACGARIGTVVSRNRELMNLILRFAQARLCPPTVDQLAVKDALCCADEYLETTKMEYKSRRDYFYAQLNSIEGVKTSKPEGAFYLMAELPVRDSEDFAVWLLKDFDLNGETVMVSPAEGFYGTPGMGKNQVRLAYVLTRDKLEKTIAILRAALEAYPGTIR